MKQSAASGATVCSTACREMQKINSFFPPDKPDPAGGAAIALLRAGFRPRLLAKWRRYQAEYQRISKGGEPPASLSRSEAMGGLADLIRGVAVVLGRIDRLTYPRPPDRRLPAPG